MHSDLSWLYAEIARHESNQHLTQAGMQPLFDGSSQARVVIIGQAPGVRAQASQTVWNDASGERLIRWLGVTEEEFRDPLLFAHMPMDFYYPGKGATGDNPPRKTFAPLWHARMLEAMPNIQLVLLVGKYAQDYYLGTQRSSLTQTVQAYQQYLPRYFPLVHPSPLNFRWFMKNPWFEAEVVDELTNRIRAILNDSARHGTAP